MDEYTGSEKRQFLRFAYSKPVRFNTVDSLKDKKISSRLCTATSRNISTSGIYFITQPFYAPAISSLLLLDLDYNAVSICREIDGHVLFIDKKLVGRVVRLEDNVDGTCGVGVAFIKKAASR